MTVMNKMKTKELLIVSLTTWSARVGNIPTVLNTIYSQTVLPDKVVLNLAYNEVIPENVQHYIDEHNIEVFRTEDTKVYKKFLPTLKRYKDACVINIDDDLLYPNTMIEDFVGVHLNYPNNPICGNHVYCMGRICHCGAASLTKYAFFGDYLDVINDDLMKKCTSSDMVFTYLATKAGHPYIPTDGFYGSDYLESFDPTNAWSGSINNSQGIEDTFKYMEKHFGPLPDFFKTYIDNPSLANLITELNRIMVMEEQKRTYYETEQAIRNSKTYRLGCFIKSPIMFIKKIIR